MRYFEPGDAVEASAINKGETLLDTAMTLNAMHPDVLVVRHPFSGAVQLISEKVECAVINAGDGFFARGSGKVAAPRTACGDEQR